MQIASESGSAVSVPAWGAHRQRLAVLALILAAGTISTGLHYAHNFVNVHHYPQSDLATFNTTRLGILIVWPLLTAVGLLGYLLYSRRIFGLAHVCIAAYSFLGLVTLGHFVDGSPDIPPFWYATIFTDALAGIAALVFVVWSTLATSAEEQPRSAVAR